MNQSFSDQNLVKDPLERKVSNIKSYHKSISMIRSKWSDLHGNNKLFERNFDTFKGL